jgi:hypothetical protein
MWRRGAANPGCSRLFRRLLVSRAPCRQCARCRVKNRCGQDARSTSPIPSCEPAVGPSATSQSINNFLNDVLVDVVRPKMGLRIDEKASGPTAAQTLIDVTELARVSAPQQAELLCQRSAESSDARVGEVLHAGAGERGTIERPGKRASRDTFERAIASGGSSGGAGWAPIITKKLISPRLRPVP